MIYDVIERAETVAKANFVIDIKALETLKDVDIDTTVSFYKRLDANIFFDKKLPGLGIYAEGATSGAKLLSGARRENTVFLIFDYMARGTVAANLSFQIELAVEAIMQTIDRLAESTTNVLGAGEAKDSVVITIERQAQSENQPHYEERVLVRVPVNEEDTGL